MDAAQGTDPANVKLPPLGAALTALIATFAIGLSVFLFLLDQRMPVPGWSVLGATLLVNYLEYRFLPGLRERRTRSNARAEGKRLLKIVHRSMKQQRDWTGTETREKLDAATARLTAALADNGSDIFDATQALEALAEQTFPSKSILRESAEQIGVALLAALALRAFFYEPFKIPSGSMLPTLDVGDQLFVNKFVYGLRIPFTVKKIFTRYPERGDIVVFNKPGDITGDDIIKRVIGFPGDVISVHDRHVTVNGKPLATEELPDIRLNGDGDAEGTSKDGPFYPIKPFEETIGKHRHIALEILDRQWSSQAGNKEGTWTVEPGKVFVMGDNRDNSEDSRFPPGRAGGFGQVPVEYIKGRADIIWMSYGGPRGVRLDRVFKRLH